MANNLSSKEQKFTENNEIPSIFNIHIFTSVQIAAKFFLILRGVALTKKGLTHWLIDGWTVGRTAHKHYTPQNFVASGIKISLDFVVAQFTWNLVGAYIHELI